MPTLCVKVRRCFSPPQAKYLRLGESARSSCHNPAGVSSGGNGCVDVLGRASGWEEE
jgi:hypothetical protein